MVTKLDLLLSLWMCHRIFFHMVWRVMVYGGQIIIKDRFFFSFFFLAGKVHNCSFFFQFQSLFFNFLFRSYSFYKSFVFFQTSLSITISHMFCFSFRSLFFWFLIFSLDSFVKVFLAFNFIIQSKFLLLYFFQFDSRSFDLFFILLNLFFISI